MPRLEKALAADPLAPAAALRAEAVALPADQVRVREQVAMVAVLVAHKRAVARGPWAAGEAAAACATLGWSPEFVPGAPASVEPEAALG